MLHLPTFSLVLRFNNEKIPVNTSTEVSIYEAWVRLYDCRSLSALRQIQSCIQSCQSSKAPSHDCKAWLKPAGVCSHTPDCHTPRQIKPTACRAGCSHCLLNAQCTRVLRPCTGRKVTICFAGRNAFSSVCFPSETLRVDATQSQRWMSDDLSLVIFPRLGFTEMYYCTSSLQPASKPEESLINFRHLGMHWLRYLQITYLELWRCFY